MDFIRRNEIDSTDKTDRADLILLDEEKREAGGTCEALDGGEVFFARRLIEIPDEVDIATSAGAGVMAEFELFEDCREEGLGALRGIDDETTAAIPERFKDEGVRDTIAIDTEEIDGATGFPECGQRIWQCGGVFREADKGIATAGEVGELFC